MTDATALRPRLFGIAYRVLGAISDAEDVVQSAYLRLEEQPEGSIRNPGGWLATVTARLAIDRARAVARERETYVGVWLPEPIVDADPAAQTTQSDDLTIGFLRVLERLQPEERTALLLHDAFDYSHAEIGTMLGKREDAVRQMCSRARTRLRDERPRVVVDRRRATELTERLIRALEAGDPAELRAVLATDVVSMADGGGVVNAGINPIVGIERVARLLHGVATKYWQPAQKRLIGVNGMPGIGLYLDDVLYGTIALDVADDGISAIYVTVNPKKLRAEGPEQPLA